MHRDSELVRKATMVGLLVGFWQRNEGSAKGRGEGHGPGAVRRGQTHAVHRMGRQLTMIHVACNIDVSTRSGVEDCEKKGCYPDPKGACTPPLSEKEAETNAEYDEKLNQWASRVMATYDESFFDVLQDIDSKVTRPYFDLAKKGTNEHFVGPNFSYLYVPGMTDGRLATSFDPESAEAVSSQTMWTNLSLKIERAPTEVQKASAVLERQNEYIKS